MNVVLQDDGNVWEVPETTLLLPTFNRSTMTVVGLEEEHVSALVSVTMHCSVADDPSRTTLPVRVADGAGTVGAIVHRISH